MALPFLSRWSRRQALGSLGAAGVLGGLGWTFGRSATTPEAAPLDLGPPGARPPADHYAGLSLAHVHRRGYGYGSDRCRAELARIAGLGANAVSLMPFGYVPALDSVEIRYGGDGSLTDDDLCQAVTDAHALGLKVCIKPHLWSRAFWRGDASPQSLDASNAPGGWAAWFDYYGAFAAHFAVVAESVGAELLCVGLELTAATLANPGAWAQVAARCRAVYKGKLTYGANWWEEAEGFHDWDAFDYIGVNAYYPISTAPDPTLSQLTSGWQAPLAKLAALSTRSGRPVLFTEAGFRSVRGAAANPWDQNGSGSDDPALQARAVAGLLAAIASQPWLDGVFLWKWFTDGGMEDEDAYDLRGGPAESAIARAWGGAAGGSADLDGDAARRYIGGTNKVP